MFSLAIILSYFFHENCLNRQTDLTFRWLSILFGSIGIGLSYYVITKWWKLKNMKRMKDEMKRKLEETRKDRRKNVRNINDLSDNELCVACK